MMAAAMAPPLRASAGCGAATAASPMVAAAGRAVRVLVVLVMAHLWFAKFVFIQRRLSLFPANFVWRQHLSWARGSSLSREWPVNSPFGNGLRGCLRGLNFGNAWAGRRQKHCLCEVLCRAPRDGKTALADARAASFFMSLLVVSKRRLERGTHASPNRLGRADVSSSSQKSRSTRRRGPPVRGRPQHVGG